MMSSTLGGELMEMAIVMLFGVFLYFLILSSSFFDLKGCE